MFAWAFPLNNGVDWNDIDWVDSDWSDFDWETVWSDYDLGNVVDWDNIPWGDIIDLNIFPDDLITYIQNIIALGQGFNWNDFVVSMQGGEDCCINPAWIDPMAMCTMDWNPVVGCDGVQYGNSCQAEAAGVTSWTDPSGFTTSLEWDCNQGGVDCVDDPEGILAQYGYQCNDIVGEWFSWDCADDLSVAVPGIGFGISIYEICPQSCNACGDDIEGCMQTEACNYNEEATIDDGSCDYGVQCLVSPCSTTPSPYPGASCVDDYCEGCCAIWTWTNEQGYDFTFNSCTDEYTEGCTESNAINYNPDAILDDGSCEYAWDDCFSQQILESFGNYNLGNIDSQSSDWIGWDNGNSGVDVVDFSMNTYLGDGQSILVEQGDDLVWDLDGINTGSGELTFYMYIPSTDDAGAYYNMLHNYDAANSNWAFQVLFASASSGDQSYIDLDQPVYFDALYDTWVEVRHEIDIDNDLITLYYNGEMLSSWAWSSGSAGLSSVLDALNFYGFCTGTPCSGFTYYDNIEICGDFYNNVNIEEESSLNVNLYPNPNKGSFNIVLNEEQVEFNIRVFNILGKEVYNEVVDGYVKNSIKTIDLALTKGTYIVNLETNNRVVKIPMIIK